MNRVKFGSLKNVSAPLVLVVEDDDDTRLMMKYLLETWKYRVIEADSGETGILLAESRQPDAILLDCKLPKIDGLTTIRRMREQPTNAQRIIISICENAEPSVRDSILAAGSDDFLSKPINFGELENSLKKLLRSGEKYKREGFIT